MAGLTEWQKRRKAVDKAKGIEPKPEKAKKKAKE